MKIDGVLRNDKKITIGELFAKYEATKKTLWNIKLYVAGEMYQEHLNLSFAECKKIFLREDKNTEQCVRVFAGENKMTIMDSWQCFRQRKEDWIKYL